MEASEKHEFEPIEVCQGCEEEYSNCECEGEPEYEPIDECKVCGMQEDDDDEHKEC